MKQTRKGLGLGKGSGYYNIIPQYDSYVHSLSAKGVKTHISLQAKAKGLPKKWEKHKPKDKNTTSWGRDYNSLVIELKEINGKYRVRLINYYSEDEDGDIIDGNDYWSYLYDKDNLTLKEANKIVDKLMDENTNLYAKGLPKGWTVTEEIPDNDGGIQEFVNYQKGKLNVEVVRYYDDDKDKYDDFYSVFRQVEYEEGAWDGDEMGTFKTLKEAKQFAKELVKEFDNDRSYTNLFPWEKKDKQSWVRKDEMLFADENVEKDGTGSYVVRFTDMNGESILFKSRDWDKTLAYAKKISKETGLLKEHPSVWKKL